MIARIGSKKYYFWGDNSLRCDRVDWIGLDWCGDTEIFIVPSLLQCSGGLARVQELVRSKEKRKDDATSCLVSELTPHPDRVLSAVSERERNPADMGGTWPLQPSIPPFFLLFLLLLLFPLLSAVAEKKVREG